MSDRRRPKPFVVPPHEPPTTPGPDGSDLRADEGRRPSLDAPVQTFRRRLFVRHQQQLAQQALLLDMPGGARAALRVLSGVDFEEAAAAASFLRTLRDARAPRESVIDAISAVLHLTPAGDTPLPGRGRPREDMPEQGGESEET